MGDEVLHDVFVEVAQIARLILVDCLDAAPDHVLVPAQVTSATSCSCSGTWTMNAPPWVMTCEAVRACGRTLEDLRSPRPVIRGLPATAGSLRRFQADSGAGSTRDEKKPAVVMSNTYTDLQGFYGSDGTRTCDLRELEPATSGVIGHVDHRNAQPTATVFARFRASCARPKGSIVRRQSRQRSLARRSTGRARMRRSTVGAGAKTIPNTNLTKTRVPLERTPEGALSRVRL